MTIMIVVNEDINLEDSKVADLVEVWSEIILVKTWMWKIPQINRLWVNLLKTPKVKEKMY